MVSSFGSCAWLVLPMCVCCGLVVVWLLHVAFHVFCASCLRSGEEGMELSVTESVQDDYGPRKNEGAPVRERIMLLSR